jgi:DNA-binding response OmpR family regulator
MRILVIEDEHKVARFLARGLKEESYVVEVAHDGEEGLHFTQNCDYDVIVLDIMLPKKDGFEVLQTLRAKGKRTRVLMLTAKDAIKDRVRGLNAGADDYLCKPFAFEEFLARVRALLRRESAGEPTKLQVADLTLDLLTHQVTRASEPLVLTAQEYALLEYLMRHAGQVVTRTQIIQHVWKYSYDPLTNVTDVYVHYLRNKIDQGFEKGLD